MEYKHKYKEYGEIKKPRSQEIENSKKYDYWY